MENEKIFINGFMCKKPHVNAPSFILFDVSFKADELVKFLEEHKNASGYVNGQIKESKGGKYYAELNTYEKKAEPVKEVDTEAEPF